MNTIYKLYELNVQLQDFEKDIIYIYIYIHNKNTLEIIFFAVN